MKSGEIGVVRGDRMGGGGNGRGRDRWGSEGGNGIARMEWDSWDRVE